MAEAVKPRIRAKASRARVKVWGQLSPSSRLATLACPCPCPCPSPGTWCSGVDCLWTWRFHAGFSVFPIFSSSLRLLLLLLHQEFCLITALICGCSSGPFQNNVCDVSIRLRCLQVSRCKLSKKRFTVHKSTCFSSILQFLSLHLGEDVDVAGCRKHGGFKE